MRFLRQPKGSHQCSQTCIAMVADLTTREVCQRINHYIGMTHQHWIRAFNRLGIPCSQTPERFPKFRNWQVERELWPSFAMAAIEDKKGRGHAIIMFDGKIYDPSVDGFYPIYPMTDRLVRYISIFRRPRTVDLKNYTEPKIEVCGNCQRSRPWPFEMTMISENNGMMHCGCYFSGGGRLHVSSNPMTEANLII